MPSTPSDRLRVELQARGENVNSWGDGRLNNALKRLEEAVAGILTLTITGDIVLQSENYIVDQARMGTLVLTGTPAANFRVTIPGVQKTYNVINLTPRVANFGVADMATVSVRAGLSNLVVCDGAVTRVVDLTLDQIRTAAAAVNLGGQRIANVAAATADTDGINRGQAVSLTSGQVTRAQEWANKTGAVVDVGEYSAKEYAVGTTVPSGSAFEWATLTGTAVAASEYSAKEYAVGSAVPAGSAREWSITVGGLVDASEYAAKEYAIGTTVPAGSARRWAIGSIGDGSAKDWATLLSSIVAASEYSAKEYAVGATAPLGSAKRWATATGVVADGLLGARGYANNSASSAQTSTDQAAISTNQAGAAAGFAQSAADRLADFNNRYVVASQFPTTGNFAGRLAFATSGNQFGVFDSGTGAYQTITSPSQATETTAGIVRLATASEALDGTNTQAALTPSRVRSAAGVRYRARTSNTQLTATDNNTLIDATGTFTQTFATPSALGANWSCSYKNAGTGNITIPASDGRTNWIMYPGEMRLFQCDGTTLRSEVLNPFSIVFLNNGTFVPPPGYLFFQADFLNGAGGGGNGASGGAGANRPQGASGSSGVFGYGLPVAAATLPLSVSISIGAGGSVPGGDGGRTLFGSLGLMEVGRGGNSATGSTAPGIARSLNLSSDTAGVNPVGLAGVNGAQSTAANTAPIFEGPSALFGFTHRGGAGAGGFANGVTGDPATAGSPGALRIEGVL